MTTQLKRYNDALRLLGERNLSSITENREPRRVLDSIWDDGAIDHCLEQALWTFAKRTIELTYNPSIGPTFGYQYAFDQPSDWIRTIQVSGDEYFETPLLAYSKESSYWFCDLQTIYIQYVSNDNQYGADLSLWPTSFSEYLSAYMASKAAKRLTQSSSDMDALNKKMEDLLAVARSKDAMEEPTKFPPTGNWVKSRGGRSGHRNNKSSLLG